MPDRSERAESTPGARTSPPRVLIDSSVWIDYYRPGPAAALRSAVIDGLTQDAVFTMPLIVAEVVQGAPDEETLETLLDDFHALRQIEVGFEVGKRAARIGYAMRRLGNPTPTADLLIAAAALAADSELWHRDVHFTQIARVAPLRERRL